MKHEPIKRKYRTHVEREYYIQKIGEEFKAHPTKSLHDVAKKFDLNNSDAYHYYTHAKKRRLCP